MSSQPDEPLHIAVVVPAYRVAGQIADVVRGIPELVRTIVVINDGSTDDTGQVIAQLCDEQTRLVAFDHDKNMGVGRAVCTGYEQALELGADIVVKMDGDGQMSPDYLEALLAPLICGEADYAKGNRFYDFEQLRQMPTLRLLGNGVLGFLVRFTSGYWSMYDPTNGYTAIQASVLRRLRLKQLHRGYFFETHMLNELALLDATVVDVGMPARYGDEKSSLRIWRVMLLFPWLLARCFLKRLWLRHILLDFTAFGLFFVVGVLLMGFGAGFGAVKWYESYLSGITASTGWS